MNSEMFTRVARQFLEIGGNMPGRPGIGTPLGIGLRGTVRRTICSISPVLLMLSGDAVGFPSVLPDLDLVERVVFAHRRSASERTL